MTGLPTDPEEVRGGGPTLPLKVSDIKQFAYCPRIVYYTYVLPVEKASTYKMDVGREEHASLESKESRRTLRRYGLHEGERRFRVGLQSPRLGLTGVLDLLIVTEGKHYPVEFKDAAGGEALHHRYQLGAYCLLVEDVFRTTVRSGFLYMISENRVVPVPLTTNLRRRVIEHIVRIRDMVTAEKMPPATRRKAKCRVCEFKNYCQDWA
jgi:CRISPR-associated exonuclease Cas4